MLSDARILVLASSSPRRRQLLGQLGIPLEVDAPSVDETDQPGEAPPAYVARVAKKKGQAVVERHAGRVVLAADTAVVVDGRILGKPQGSEQARHMLRTLSGRAHEVRTGVFAAGPAGEEALVVTTRVIFRTLSEEEIGWYVATGEPLDKAGAYAIQERGSAFVRAVEGSHSNVVGLPLVESLALLDRVGLVLPWRELT